MLKKIILNLGKALIGFGVLGLLIWKGGLNPGETGKALLAHPVQALTALFLLLSLSVVAGVRWYLFLKAAKINVTFARVFSLHMIGLFFVTLIPGGTGGDVVKAIYLYKDIPENKGLALMTIAVDRLVGLYALLFWGMLGVVLNLHMAFSTPTLQANTFFYLSVFGAYTCLIIVFLSPFGEHILRWVMRLQIPGKAMLMALSESLALYRKNPKVLFSGFLMTLVVHGSILLMFYQLALALDVGISLRTHSFVVPIITMINGLPISPGGIGVGEAAGTFLYRLQGVEQGAAILLLYHFYVVLMALLGAPFYFFYRKEIPQNRAFNSFK